MDLFNDLARVLISTIAGKDVGPCKLTADIATMRAIITVPLLTPEEGVRLVDSLSITAKTLAVKRMPSFALGTTTGSVLALAVKV